MSAIEDVAALVDLVRSKQEMTTFEARLAEIASSLADIVQLLERPEPERAPGMQTVSAPAVTVNVEPTPYQINVSPAAAAATQSSSQSVEIVRDAGGAISRLIITKQA